MNSIHQSQEEISREFTHLNGDKEQILFYLIQQGQQLSALSGADKTDDHLIKGCHSKVWLKAAEENGLIYFYADSNTAITKGLIFLLIRVLNGQSAKTILEAELYFMNENHLDRFIGVQRSNGFAAILSQMKASTNKVSSQNLYE